MKYGKEVIELLSSNSTRSFAMRQIVNYVYHGPDARQRQRIRKGVLRVIKELVQSGCVIVHNEGVTNHTTAYQWRV